MTGYWVTYGADVRSGPFPDYDIAAREADRLANKMSYVNYEVRYGTRAEVTQ